MERSRSLKSLSRQTGACESDMRLPTRWVAHRRVLVLCVVLSLLGLLMVSVPLIHTQSQPHTPADWSPVTATHRQQVHAHVERVLEGECRPGGSRRQLLGRLPSSSQHTEPFLWRGSELTPSLLLYPPPFGFKGLHHKIQGLLNLLPEAPGSEPPAGNASAECRRCVVVGNGGILRGLELGGLIDRFHTVIRLNSGPLGVFSADVGNRTSFRVSYPEGTALRWADAHAHTRFVAVVYKGVDISWISAMINKMAVPLLDWLFFWQKVPDQVPVPPERFRLLNPLVIRESALHLLQYPEPRQGLWGSYQTVPTIGISALNLASLLCDEVSLAGFGYLFGQRGAPLHYYDSLPMSAMLAQSTHNVNTETLLLRELVRDGTITDLTGGIHCPFCPS